MIGCLMLPRNKLCDYPFSSGEPSMGRNLFIAAALVLFALVPVKAGETIRMSTTTSTRDSGLLDYLLPELANDTGIAVQVLAKGTGAAIRDGVDGNVDVIFVHDTPREEKFVADGYGTKRYAVMHNDFVIVGPPSDPAGIKGMKNVLDALRTIAAKKQPFISRGDDSGTHAKELALWKEAGLAEGKTEMKIKRGDADVSVSFATPQGDWYLSIGQGMGKTLFMAEEKEAYALADRGTFIQQKFGKTPPTSLEIMVEGDQGLFNPYGVIPVNPAKYPDTKIAPATRFAEWLVSPRGQAVIANYKLEGKQLFFPDAIPDAK